MSHSPYIILSGLSLGETSFVLAKEQISASYIDFILTAYGTKWQSIDVSFEYRFSNDDQWREDASIIGSQSSYIQGNKLLGLKSEAQGYNNRFRWKYADNNVSEGMEIQTRLRLLPRTKNFSNYDNTVVNEAYGDSFFDFNGISSKNCVGKDLYGRYICLDDTSIGVYTSLSDTVPLYSYSGLSSPTFAKQIRTGGYIVANTNSIIELDEELSTVTKTYNIPGNFYSVDYSEQNKTLLIVRNFPSYPTYVYEITWQDGDYGSIIWNSLPLGSGSISPRIIYASYNRNNFDEIVMTNGLYVYIIDKLNQSISEIDAYNFANGNGESKYKAFVNPYRVYFHDDNTICVIEKDGEVVDFNVLYSSSSSSIDSSSSSTSSSSSIDSSSSSSSTSNSSSSSTSSSSSSSSLDNRGIGVMIIESTFIVG